MSYDRSSYDILDDWTGYVVDIQQSGKLCLIFFGKWKINTIFSIQIDKKKWILFKFERLLLINYKSHPHWLLI
jgi:hypothetical protein